MLNTNNAGSVNQIRSRTAFALIAATLLVGGSATEASAKSRHHRHHSHHVATSDWRNANASIGSGHSFSGRLAQGIMAMWRSGGIHSATGG